MQPLPVPDRQPVDPDFNDRVRSSFAQQAAMALAHSARVTQQHGFIHAGIVSTALDSACGYAAATRMTVTGRDDVRH
jgi:acyl-coenzyme A thioesterase PaaI-like protein